MLVKTQNSTYEFNVEFSTYRKVQPIESEWKIYFGFISEPKIGNPLKIMRDESKITTTSIIVDIIGIDDE